MNMLPRIAAFTEKFSRIKNQHARMQREYIANGGDVRTGARALSALPLSYESFLNALQSELSAPMNKRKSGADFARQFDATIKPRNEAETRAIEDEPLE